MSAGSCCGFGGCRRCLDAVRGRAACEKRRGSHTVHTPPSTFDALPSHAPSTCATPCPAAGEAAKWEAFARQYWAGSGRLGAADIAGVLGGEGHLKGEGEGGSGVLLSTRFRRAWQCE